SGIHMSDFAIVVPVGHYDPRLATALNSLQMQDVAMNVVLMDASADPRTTEVADKFDELFWKRCHEPDEGQADAIGKGWETAPGKYVGWLNADDALLPGALNKVQAAFETEQSTQVVTGQSTIVDSGERFTGFHRSVKPVSPDLLRGNTISQPSCFVRREALQVVGGIDRTLHYTMDWDLWIRLYEAGVSFHHIDAPLSRVLMGAETKTAEFTRKRRNEIWKLARRNHSRFTALKTTTGFLLEHLKAASPVIKPLISGLFPVADDRLYFEASHCETVPLLNLAQDKPESIIIQWQSLTPGAKLEYTVNGVTCPVQQAQNEHRISLRQEISMKAVLELEIRCAFGRAQLAWLKLQ
ncbi:MAG: glycosyltransferase, partial [Aquisalinus sp.]|nr:glycosyltransferase [Aquisalinus sp.]